MDFVPTLRAAVLLLLGNVLEGASSRDFIISYIFACPLYYPLLDRFLAVHCCSLFGMIFLRFVFLRVAHHCDWIEGIMPYPVEMSTNNNQYYDIIRPLFGQRIILFYAMLSSV